MLRLAGALASDAALAELIESSDAYVDTFWIGPDENVVLPPGTDAHFGNHSCEPTLRRAEPMTFVAARDLDVGDELTIDYAVISGPGAVWSPCSCGAGGCRGTYPG